MEKKYIDILFKIGESQSLDDESKQLLTSIDDGYYINYSENWSSNIIKSFTDNELINIFKGLIIAEQCYSDLCGSATVGKILYREIESRYIDRDLNIANWAYTNTRNGYIPFDSNGNIRSQSKDAYEFIRNSKSINYYNLSEYAINRINELQQYLDKTIINEKNVIIQTLENKILKKERIIDEYKNKLIDLKFRLKIAEMSSTEKANEIINDNSRPIYYYYKEIEILINDKSVAKNLLEKILTRFKEKERKNIKDLKNRLLEEITNR